MKKWIDKYRRVVQKIKDFYRFRGLPAARYVEGTSTIQCLCPRCDYADGYNRPFIAASAIACVLTCDKCATKFVGLV